MARVENHCSARFCLTDLYMEVLRVKEQGRAQFLACCCIVVGISLLKEFFYTFFKKFKVIFKCLDLWKMFLFGKGRRCGIAWWEMFCLMEGIIFYE